MTIVIEGGPDPQNHRISALQLPTLQYVNTFICSNLFELLYNQTSFRYARNLVKLE